MNVPVSEPSGVKNNGSKAAFSNFLFYKLRFKVFVLIAIFTLIVPFLKINGNQLLMMSFLHMEFHLLGISFDMQELYLIPLILIMFFVFLFTVTSLGGRMWCGWGCPQTMFRTLYRDLIQGALLGLRKRHLKTKPLKLKKWSEKLKYVIGLLLFAPLMFVASANMLWFFVEPFEFIDLLLNHTEDHIFLFGFWIGISLFLIFDITFLAERFCQYICPYARIQSVLFDADTPVAIYDKTRGDNSDGSRSSKNLQGVRDNSGDCTGCMACVRVCPANIDIRDGLQLACVACLECSDACKPVMEREGKENLVRWTSEKVLEGHKLNLLRPRIWVYAVIFVIVGSILIYSGNNRETVLVNVNRTTQLYVVKNDGKIVENHYVLLLTNIDDKPHTYSLSTMELEGVQLKRPKTPFTIRPGGRLRKVVVISTEKMLVNDSSRNTSIPYKIKTVAVDEPDRVFSIKPAIFIFPAAGEVKMQK